MLLFYVDESGTTGMPRGHHTRHGDLFSLAAVGIPDASRSSLAEDLLALRRATFGDAVDRPDAWAQTELKARYLWQLHETIGGRRHDGLPGPYRALADKESFHRLLHGIERVFAKFRPIVFAAIVDKPRLPGPQSAVTLGRAYAALYQSVALTMENVYGGASAAFVADQQDEHEAFFNSGQLGRMRDEHASTGVYRPNFNLLLDKPMWIDPKLSVWDREIIQLADLAAFATRAWASQGQPPAERHFLWRAIHPSLASDWRRGTGVRGAGLAIIPDPGPDFPPID